MLFPFVLTAAGLIFLFLGVQLHRHGKRLEAAITGAMPESLKRLRPVSRSQ